jgi:HAMP domain-containing protein
MRLFFLLGTLVALLVAAEWWLVRTLARDLSTEIGEVAFRVGESVVASVALQGGPAAWHGVDLVEDDLRLNESTAGGGLTRRFVIRTEAGEMKTVEEVGVEPDIARASGTLVHALGDAETALEGLSPEETYLLLQALQELRDKSGSFPGTPRVSVLDEEGRELEGEAMRAALQDGESELVLKLDSPFESRFLTLSGSQLDERIPIPREGVDEALTRFRERLLAGSGALLLAGLAFAAFIAHRATAPLRELSLAARQLGEGALGTQVEIAAAGDVGDAVTAFNGMSRRWPAVLRTDSATR